MKESRTGSKKSSEYNKVTKDAMETYRRKFLEEGPDSIGTYTDFIQYGERSIPLLKS